MEGYESYLPISRDNNPLLSPSKREFFVEDPFDFIYSEPTREQDALAVVQNPSRFIYLRTYEPIQKASLSNIGSNVYEYPNTVILEPSDPLMTGLSSFYKHDAESNLLLPRPDEMYPKTKMPSNGARKFHPVHVAVPSPRKMHNIFTRPDSEVKLKHNKQHIKPERVDDVSSRLMPNKLSPSDYDVTKTSSEDTDDQSTRELKSMLSHLLKKYFN